MTDDQPREPGVSRPGDHIVITTDADILVTPTFVDRTAWLLERGIVPDPASVRREALFKARDVVASCSATIETTQANLDDLWSRNGSTDTIRSLSHYLERAKVQRDAAEREVRSLARSLRDDFGEDHAEAD